MSLSQGRPPYSRCPYILVSEASLPEYEDQFCSTNFSRHTLKKRCNVCQSNSISVLLVSLQPTVHCRVVKLQVVYVGRKLPVTYQ